MQYIRLTDKKGKDIYERDVVLIDNDVWTVMYDAPHFWISKKGEVCDTFYSDCGALYEVIGNVYVSPEFLE